MQLRLFEPPPASEVSRARCAAKLDADSEALLEAFRQARAQGGAHPKTVLREVSQLRSLGRSSGLDGERLLRHLFENVPVLARCLREPPEAISLSTGRARLVAVQRFVAIQGPAVGIRDPSAFLSSLEMLLPRKNPAGWHSAGIMVGGTPRRARPTGPTLRGADIQRIVRAAGEVKDRFRASRDSAIVALSCFSGLRPEETVALTWGQVVVDSHTETTFVEVQRRGGLLRLPIPAPAAGPLLDYALQHREDLEGPLFRRRARSQEGLSVRAARHIVVSACERAGLPRAESAGLRAAFAHWLRSRGLSDHETAKVLGLRQVRSLDRLLAPTKALDAQRAVRELVGP